MTSPDAAAQFQAAGSHISLGQFAEAETILRELLRKSPDKLQYYEMLTKALFGLKKFDESLELFCKVLSRHAPTSDSTYEAIYVDGLRATGSSPAPFVRLLRFYELVRQLETTRGVAGEIAECGCFRGMSSFLICSYLRRENPEFIGDGYHIFDSFEGLADPTTEDEVPENHENAVNLNFMSQRGAFAASSQTVKQSLSAFPRIAYHPGWIPASFDGLAPQRYRFVHVDVDHYDPTWDCLDYFYPKLSPGGLLVSDDFSWPGARRAIEEFSRERDIEFLMTPYQQALLYKAI